MRSWAVPAWAAVLAAVVLGPVLGPGFVLSYDMVFVPDPSFSWNQLGLGPELPRAVPLDAVTTALSALVPGAVLQKAVLCSILVAAGIGAARLVPSSSGLVRLVAVTVAIWNPYVAERLVLGHWGLLLAYGALPWMVTAARCRREGSGGLPRLLLLVAVCALTPTGGLLGLAVLMVAGWSREPAARRRLAAALGGWLLLNAPWWLPGVLHASAARTDEASVGAFAARAELPGGVLPTLLGLGGVWNGSVVPDSRSTPLAVVGLLLMLVLAVAGGRLLVRRDRQLAVVLGVLAGLGLVLALLGALPGTREALQWLVATVPGGGLLRDGHKFVALAVPFAAVVAACGAERLAGLVPDRPSAAAVVCGVALLQVALLPDLAWGAGRRLDAVHYPDSWSQVRASVAAEQGRGDLLLLPWGSFRRYPWNGGRTVLDPARRFFPREVLGDDRLVIGDTVLAAEDPRAAAVVRRLASGRLDMAFLRGHGVRLVLVQTDQPGDTRSVDGTVEVARRQGLLLARVPGPVTAPEAGPAGGPVTRTAVVLVDLAAAAAVLAALLSLVVRRRRGRS